VSRRRINQELPDTVLMFLLVHQFGLFSFRTGKNSLPSTPTASTRSRAAIFGLDVISRNLFNARQGSSKGDFFGGSINGHRRSKSAVSRSSTYTQTTTTGDDSLMKFSYRSNSTATAATTVSTMEDDTLLVSQPSRSRKLLKRGKSPSGLENEASASRSSSRANSWQRSPSTERRSGYSDRDEDDAIILHKMDQSEMDLTMQLELARQNSQNQHNKQVPALPVEKPVEETIYEGKHFSSLYLSTQSLLSRGTSTSCATTIPNSQVLSKPSFDDTKYAYQSHGHSSSRSLFFSTLVGTSSFGTTVSFSFAPESTEAFDEPAINGN
jgi:protein ECT2